MNECDPDKFSMAMREFDSVKKMEGWEIQMFTRLKEKMLKDAENEAL